MKNLKKLMLLSPVIVVGLMGMSMLYCDYVMPPSRRMPYKPAKPVTPPSDVAQVLAPLSENEQMVADLKKQLKEQYKQSHCPRGVIVRYLPGRMPSPQEEAEKRRREKQQLEAERQAFEADPLVVKIKSLGGNVTLDEIAKNVCQIETIALS